MDGYSDLPFRALCRQLGSAMSYTEFINAIDVTGKHPHLEQKLAYREDERPLVYQLFDNDPDRLLAAARKLRRRSPDIIDVNMGCSDKSVSGRGAGAGLLREPEKIARIFALLTRELDLPITGKIRLGWDADSRNYLDVAHILEDNGAALIAVHGRTKQQGYHGEADWDAIAQVCQAVKIPVIANGDVRTVADIERIRVHTGCAAVMIGRAAVSNPWIFSHLDREQVSFAQVEQTMRRQLDLMLEFYGGPRGLVLFRKYASRYLSPLGLSDDQRRSLMTAAAPQDFWRLLSNLHP